ncbi:hypothetical protein PEC301877_26090 [Pectobacterium carotovorum subsp. carotovorum]|nr:hypothetical protein PEC301877_26090 [Pectobacterium carotovorum subsp. carotovorum]
MLTRLALELNLHVFLRSSELRFTRWDEFNLKAHIWSGSQIRGKKKLFLHFKNYLG